MKLFRQFYFTYPQIGQTLSAQFQLPENERTIGVQPPELIGQLSFSQFTELIRIDDPLKRAFYEIECIKGNWSVRELNRQITSLYFERSGLSKDKAKLSQYVQNRATTLSPKDVVQDPFFFEFLGLKDKDIIKENDLEQALLDNLQEFILELERRHRGQSYTLDIIISTKHLNSC